MPRQLCSAPALWGLSTPRTERSQVLRGWKSSSALPRDAPGVSPLAPHSLSRPLCLSWLLAAPRLLPYSEVRENVLLSECPYKEGETCQAEQDLVLPR